MRRGGARVNKHLGARQQASERPSALFRSGRVVGFRQGRQERRVRPNYALIVQLHGGGGLASSSAVPPLVRPSVECGSYSSSQIADSLTGAGAYRRGETYERPPNRQRCDLCPDGDPRAGPVPRRLASALRAVGSRTPHILLVALLR